MRSGTIETDADVTAALAALLRLDPRLQRVAEIAGPLPLRRNARGLRGLAGTIIGQQVSRASADAIFGRLCAEVAIDDAAAVLAATDEALRRAGLSRAKIVTLRAVADAIVAGRLDLTRIAAAEPEVAVAELSVIPGIGRWTAECFLLFSAGHPDVFPAGDLALQVAVGHAFDLPARPKEKAVAAAAQGWAPHRVTAARLFWAYYRAITRRDAMPVEPAG
ncbi:DNA-3-methyladenine glycosylase family protein [Mangrovicella endophytica]|uniref:DNA-3-methyladenine glycosylase family protein n=1 Tax=Mangrovicella endophytica TaxID=2066697 RepID=UPI000C9E6D36|nr:DNA-3-methyladenine glycosylase [Mangrovicella endophytica]